MAGVGLKAVALIKQRWSLCSLHNTACFEWRHGRNRLLMIGVVFLVCQRSAMLPLTKVCSRKNPALVSARVRPESKENVSLIYKKYMCVVCGWIYDEAIGAPEDGIDPGTLWTDVPADWVCPDCGVGREDFEMVEI